MRSKKKTIKPPSASELRSDLAILIEDSKESGNGISLAGMVALLILVALAICSLVFLQYASKRSELYLTSQSSKSTSGTMKITSGTYNGTITIQQPEGPYKGSVSLDVDRNGSISGIAYLPSEEGRTMSYSITGSISSDGTVSVESNHINGVRVSGLLRCRGNYKASTIRASGTSNLNESVLIEVSR